MSELITRLNAETNYVLSVTVVFPVLDIPEKPCKFPGNSIVFSFIKVHYKKKKKPHHIVTEYLPLKNKVSFPALCEYLPIIPLCMFLWTLVRILLPVVIDVRSERNSEEELLFIRKQPNKTKKKLKPFCLCDNESNRLLKSMLSLFENWWDLPLAMLLSVLPDCVCCLFSCAMFRKTVFVWEYVTLNAGTNTNTTTRVMLSHFSANRLSLKEYTTWCIYLLFKREKKQCNFVLVPDFCFHPVSSNPAPCALASNVFRLCSHYKPSTEVFSTLLCNLVNPGLAGFLYPGFSSCDSLNSLAFYLL